MIRALPTAEIKTWLGEHFALTPVPTFHKFQAGRPRPSANFENDTPGRMLVPAPSSIAWLMAGQARAALLVVQEQ